MRVDGGLPDWWSRETNDVRTTRESAVVHAEREVQISVRVEGWERGGDFVLRGCHSTRGVSGESICLSGIAVSLESLVERERDLP